MANNKQINLQGDPTDDAYWQSVSDAIQAQQRQQPQAGTDNGAISNLFKGAVQGAVGNNLEGLGGFANLLGLNSVGSALDSGADKINQWAGSTGYNQPFGFSNLVDPKYYSSGQAERSVGQLAGTLASFLIPAGWATKGAEALGAGTQLARAVGVGEGVLQGATTDAGSVYNQQKASGASDSDASSKAWTDFGESGLLMAGTMGLTEGTTGFLKSIASDAGKTAGGMAEDAMTANSNVQSNMKMLVSITEPAASLAFQGVMQDRIHQQLQGGNPDWTNFNPATMTPGEKEALVGGLISGGGLGAYAARGQIAQEKATNQSMADVQASNEAAQQKAIADQKAQADAQANNDLMRSLQDPKDIQSAFNTALDSTVQSGKMTAIDVQAIQNQLRTMSPDAAHQSRMDFLDQNKAMPPIKNLSQKIADLGQQQQDLHQSNVNGQNPLVSDRTPAQLDSLIDQATPQHPLVVNSSEAQAYVDKFAPEPIDPNAPIAPGQADKIRDIQAKHQGIVDKLNSGAIRILDSTDANHQMVGQLYDPSNPPQKSLTVIPDTSRSVVPVAGTERSKTMGNNFQIASGDTSNRSNVDPTVKPIEQHTKPVTPKTEPAEPMVKPELSKPEPNSTPTAQPEPQIKTEIPVKFDAKNPDTYPIRYTSANGEKVDTHLGKLRANISDSQTTLDAFKASKNSKDSVLYEKGMPKKDIVASEQSRINEMQNQHDIASKAIETQRAKENQNNVTGDKSIKAEVSKSQTKELPMNKVLRERGYTDHPSEVNNEIIRKALADGSLPEKMWRSSKAVPADKIRTIYAEMKAESTARPKATTEIIPAEKSQKTPPIAQEKSELAMDNTPISSKPKNSALYTGTIGGLRDRIGKLNDILNQSRGKPWDGNNALYKATQGKDGAKEARSIVEAIVRDHLKDYNAATKVFQGKAMAKSNAPEAASKDEFKARAEASRAAKSSKPIENSQSPKYTEVDPKDVQKGDVVTDKDGNVHMVMSTPKGSPDKVIATRADAEVLSGKDLAKDQIVNVKRPQFSEGRHGAPETITQDHIEKAFPGSKVTEVKGGFIAELPNGEHLLVNTGLDKIGVKGGDKEALGVYGRTEPGTKLTIGGRAVPVDHFIGLIKEANSGVLDHEAYHLAEEAALKPNEINALARKYGGPEDRAEAYRKWNPEQPNSIFQKIMKFANDILHNLGVKTNADRVFEDIKSGKVLDRVDNSGVDKARNSTLDNGNQQYMLKEFKDQDIKPMLQKANEGIKETKADVERTFNAQGVNSDSQMAGGIMRDYLAQSHNSQRRISDTFDSLRPVLDKLPEQGRYEFMDNIENDKKQSDPRLQPIADYLGRVWKEEREKVQDLGTGKLQNYYENYFPHIWAKPEEAEKFVNQWYGKRPMEGQAGFLKQRKYPTIQDGIDAGLKLISTNPVDVAMMKVHEMERYTAAHRILNEFAVRGLVTRFAPDEMIDRNKYQPINDKISNVYQVGADGQPKVSGKYFAPREVADLMNNYLSPGLREKSALFRTYLGVSNVMNQFQLGLSYFHLGFTSMDAMVSKAALGTMKVFRGDIGGGLKDIASSPNIWSNYRSGKQIMDKILKPGTYGPEIASLAKAFEAGGGRIGLDDFNRTNWQRSMKEAMAQGNKLGGLARFPFAMMEKMGEHLMDNIVPAQKLGVFADLARYELARNPELVHDQVKLRDTMGKIVDSVDNRMGQLAYDNLFWNKTLKDLAMASLRSVGWNLGTYRELGGGLYDWGKFAMNAKDPSKRELTYKMAYTIALPMMVGLMGGIMHKMFTGENPEELKDYFFPKNGEVDKNGNAQRITLPSYMKDVYHMGTAPGETLMNKLHPAIALVKEMLMNKDFYGVKIRNEEDPIFKQAMDEATHVLKSFEPFSIRNGIQMNDIGASLLQQLLPTIGITPAPGDVNKTPAEKMMSDFMVNNAPPGSKTQEQYDKQQLKLQYERGLRSNDPSVMANMRQSVTNGQLSNKDVQNLVKQKGMNMIQRDTPHLPLEQSLKVYAVANAQEQSQMAPIIKKKIQAFIANADGDDKERLMPSIKAFLKS